MRAAASAARIAAARWAGAKRGYYFSRGKQGQGYYRDAARPAADARTVRHVLSRITFGPRPGDVERVQEMGLDRYIDSQLHPERLAGTNLAGRLDGFETLGMDSRTIAQRYEIPQLQALVQAQRNGTAQPQQPPATPPAQPCQ